MIQLDFIDIILIIIAVCCIFGVIFTNSPKTRVINFTKQNKLICYFLLPMLAYMVFCKIQIILTYAFIAYAFMGTQGLIYFSLLCIVPISFIIGLVLLFKKLIKKVA